MNTSSIIPNHVAIIMDGNRRWAKAKGKKSVEGYNQGAKTLKKIATHILSQGTKVFSVFAFSTENFSRPQNEVDFLMNKFIKVFTEEFDFIHKRKIKVVFSGRKERLRDDVLASMQKLEESTKENNAGIFNICLNYGGQAEIVDACKKIAADVNTNKINIDEINENVFTSYLYQDLPPIDLLIRTSGEIRLSNFMLWQLSYAEFYFTELNFPDFNEKEYDKALEEYNRRNRRFGGD